MKKNQLLILCAIFLFVCGCAKYKSHEKIIPSTETEIIDKSIDFFFVQDEFSLSADITTIDFVSFESGETNDLYRTESIEIQVYKVHEYQNGSVFKLIISPVDNIQGYLFEGRMNIYFYYTDDKVYRLWSYVFEDGNLIEFYNNDDLLIKMLDTEEKIISNGYLVFCKESIYDDLDEGEEGLHNTVENADDEIISKAWVTKSNGESDFYEKFVWNLEEGLIEYQSGYRAEADVLELKNIVKMSN